MAKKKPKKEPVKMGRPSLYEPAYCQMLIDHMALGYSFESFAAKVDVDRDTVYNWVQIHPDFSDAKKRAISKCLLHWERLGIEYVLNETIKDPEGGSITRSLNTGVWVINMKNRFKWTDRLTTEVSGELGLVPKVVLGFLDEPIDD